MIQIVTAVVGVATAMGIIVLPTFAAHQGHNSLIFAPVFQSPFPEAEGIGVVNHVRAVSQGEPMSAWASRFNFRGLAADTAYTVVVAGRFADPTAFSGLCSFVTNSAGNGGCTSQFLGLSQLAIAQLRLGNEAGTPLLQATRQNVTLGPGLILTQDSCRELGQSGTFCENLGLK